MNANIMKTQMFHKIKYNLEVIKGHHLKIQNHLFMYIFCITTNPLKTFLECQHYEDANFALNEV